MTLTDAKLAELRAIADRLWFNSVHLIAEDDKDDALATLQVARDMMADDAKAIRAMLASAPSSGKGE